MYVFKYLKKTFSHQSKCQLDLWSKYWRSWKPPLKTMTKSKIFCSDEAQKPKFWQVKIQILTELKKSNADKTQLLTQLKKSFSTNNLKKKKKQEKNGWHVSRAPFCDPGLFYSIIPYGDGIFKRYKFKVKSHLGR